MHRSDLRRSAILAAATLSLPLAGCLMFLGENTSLDISATAQADFVVKDAAGPFALAFAPDGRVFYTEKNEGRIRVIKDGKLLDEPFAQVPVNTAEQRGLLGIALHPNFESNQRVYVFYSRSDTGANTSDPQAIVDNRVVYFVAEGDVAAGGEVFVTSLPASTETRNLGGRLAFNRDGTLLIGLGDLRDQDAAQDVRKLPGKILRYNDDGSQAGDNPIEGSPVFAFGLRRPTGLVLDPQDNTPFALDENSGSRDEIDRILPGKNYGWPLIAGQPKNAAEQAIVDEIADYANPLVDSGDADPDFVGGGFNMSGQYGSERFGHYFYGEATTGRIIEVELSKDHQSVVRRTAFATGFPTPLTDVAFTKAGTLWVATENAIFRVVPKH